MKNLKKVLALGLALVMLLGMMTVVSAADDKMTSKDLKDMDTVVNKAEVSLLVDLGVINGFEDFTFRPTETVTRAQMAKMVFYVLMGNTDASVYGGSTSKFADARGHWAEGEINYLATPGVDVVAGDDLGKFNPNATVRVAEAAKMLLVAAGWDAEDRSYVGDGWSGAIMRDANKQGLMAGVSQTALQPMTRDNAAKMIFNALNMGVVEAVRKQTFVGTGVEKLVDSYQSAQTTLGYNAFGLVKVTGLVKSIDAKGNIEFNGKTDPDFDVEVPGDASLVGQNVEFYVKTTGTTFTNDDRDPGKVTMNAPGSFDSLISAAPVAGGMKVLATVTDGIDWDGNWYDKKVDDKDNKAFVAEKDDEINYYVNGKYTDTAPTGEMASGQVAEFCDTDGNGKTDLIRVYEWTVKAVGDDGVETKTNKNGDVKVTVDGVVTTETDEANVIGYKDLEAGDVVLFYTDGTSYVIEKAQTFTGNVTSKNAKNSTLTIAGKAYAESGIASDEVKTLFSSWDKDTKTDNYTWALDKNGDVCLYVVPADAEVETKTALVLKAGFESGAPGSGLVGSAATADKANAQLLFTDGTVEVVNVVKVGEKALNAKENKLAEGDMPAAGTIVKYSVNDKKEYTLTADDGAKTITKGDVTAASKFTGELRANDATLFIVGKGNEDDGYKYTTYTGYKNLPAFAMAEAGQYLDKDGVVTVAFMTTEAFAGDAPDGYIYVTSVDDYEEVAGQSYIELTIVDAKGEESTAKFAEAPAATGLYQIKKVDENGVIEALETKATTESVTEDVKMEGGIFTVGANTYEYDSKTQVIIIELTKDGETVSYTSVSVAKAATIKAADGLEILVNGEAEKVVDTIYVIRTTEA